MKLIGLVGKLQSGKSTACGLIIQKYCNDGKTIIPAVRLAFANILKDMIFNAGLCTEEELWGKKTDFSRLMLQKIGTEIIRKQIDPEFFIKRMRDEISVFELNNPDNLVVIVDDVRFINEANLITDLGGTLIRIERPSLIQNKEENKHASEVEQDKIKTKYRIINDGTIEELGEKIKNIVKEL